MTEDGEPTPATAIDALVARDYERAGDEYTRVAWQRLATPRGNRSPFAPDDRGWVGRGLAHLLQAGITYRIADREDRAGHRGAEGVAIAEDLEHSLTQPVQHACLKEIAGDFRVVGGMADAKAAYEPAIAAYEAAADSIEDPREPATSPLFESAVAPLKQVGRSVENGEIAVDWSDLHGSDPARSGAFLTARPRYKRRRFPSLLTQAISAGYLAAPRGSTEYNNHIYRCPACGSNDINYVEDHVLCLRCSTPVDETE
ncbi:MAG: hypothetical protein SVG88_11005 [Halobacteriales archaeon]|nr:hypothetical protein [Halobacteriales archaeon]